MPLVIKVARAGVTITVEEGFRGLIWYDASRGDVERYILPGGPYYYATKAQYEIKRPFIQAFKPAKSGYYVVWEDPPKINEFGIISP